MLRLLLSSWEIMRYVSSTLTNHHGLVNCGGWEHLKLTKFPTFLFK
uniref:Uncharacterized protein n=1 Tax=Arundo donax TaxID=35708 RepID=A0A0A9ARG6_ARUDO